jgi:hypothetical protein
MQLLETPPQEHRLRRRNFQLSLHRNRHPAAERASVEDQRAQNKNEMLQSHDPKKILCCLQKDDMSMTKIERSEYNFHFPNEPLGIIINHVYERASEKY